MGVIPRALSALADPVKTFLSNSRFAVNPEGGGGVIAGFPEGHDRFRAKRPEKYLSMETIRLTRELIERLKTERGGFTGATLRAIGLRPYPPKGWTYRLQGTEITTEQYQKALEGRLILKRRQREKTYFFPTKQCANCGKELEYLETGWCEPCIWERVKSDQIDWEPMT